VSAPLPAWVLELVAAIEQSEDNHPRYYADTAISGMQPLDQCPESQFLELVPDDVRATARRWAS
jgi:hypothetical protein